MIRTINVAERNLYPNAAAPVTLASNTSTVIIPSQVNTKLEEIAYRYVQNVGSNNMYYAMGQTATANNYHGILLPYQQLDCSNHRLSINGFSAGGTTCAVTILFRNDMGRNNNFIDPIQ